jgi:hypothetical protein
VLWLYARYVVSVTYQCQSWKNHEFYYENSELLLWQEGYNACVRTDACSVFASGLHSLKAFGGLCGKGQATHTRKPSRLYAYFCVNMTRTSWRKKTWGCGPDAPLSGKIQWRDFVNTVMSFRFPQYPGNVFKKLSPRWFSRGALNLRI